MEIERKFLIKGPLPALESSYKITQCFLCSEAGIEIRVRIINTNATLTVKFVVNELCREEFEYPIPLKDAYKLMDTVSSKPPIEKIRYSHKEHGSKWEIDVFQGMNTGLLLAEIELTSPRQKFVRPSWLGEEVTGDDRYFNRNLYKNPYRSWV